MQTGPQPGLSLISGAAPASESPARAFNALAGGVTAYIYGQPDLIARRNATILMSYVLRRGFSVRPDVLSPLPLQIDADFEAARTFLARQAYLWSKSEDLNELFDACKLADEQAAAIRAFLPSLIPLDTGAIWLAREFGHIRAEREAEHARRYLAAWMTRAIIGETGAPTPIGRLPADAMQTRLNAWSDPVSPLETSLHFERVIKPFLSRIAELSRMAGPAANDHGR
jgi:hypothetical protein